MVVPNSQLWPWPVHNRIYSHYNHNYHNVASINHWDKKNQAPHATGGSCNHIASIYSSHGKIKARKTRTMYHTVTCSSSLTTKLYTLIDSRFIRPYSDVAATAARTDVP